MLSELAVTRLFLVVTEYTQWKNLVEQGSSGPGKEKPSSGIGYIFLEQHLTFPVDEESSRETGLYNSFSLD